MARARKRRGRRPASTARGRARPRARAPAPATRSPAPARPRPTRAETELLAVANEVAELVRSTADPARALETALDRVARAYAPESGLPAALFQGWLDTRHDKTARLGLAWGREQVRVGLEEAIQAARTVGAVRRDVPADVLAWLLLAACEALVHEPGDAADRVRMLLDLGRANAARS
jgi:hypothetical protein